MDLEHELRNTPKEFLLRTAFSLIIDEMRLSDLDKEAASEYSRNLLNGSKLNPLIRPYVHQQIVGNFCKYCQLLRLSPNAIQFLGKQWLDVEL